MLVADWDHIENCESISDIHIKRFKSKEVIVIKESGLHRSKKRSGTLVPRHPRRLTPSKERHDAESSLLAHEENTETSDILEDKEDSWSMSGRSQVYVLQASSCFLIPEYIDVMRRLENESESAAEHTIGGCCNTDGGDT